jgi:hypothetical protein
MSDVGQIMLAALAGVAFGLLILHLARLGRLSIRYTLGWLFVAGCVIVGGVFGAVVDPIARALGVNPTSVVLAAAMTGLLAITVQLSISASGLTELVRTLAESHAILEERVHRLDHPAECGQIVATDANDRPTKSP